MINPLVLFFLKIVINLAIITFCVVALLLVFYSWIRIVKSFVFAFNEEEEEIEDLEEIENEIPDGVVFYENGDIKEYYDF